VSNAAKLPAHLLNPPRRELKDLNVGETGYVLRASLAVSLDGNCYLDPTADLDDRGCSMIQVDRRADGFHVVLISRGQTWNPYNIHEDKGVPVVSIVEDYDPKLRDPSGEAA
jgi:hypothetical protein